MGNERETGECRSAWEMPCFCLRTYISSGVDQHARLDGQLRRRNFWAYRGLHTDGLLDYGLVREKFWISL